MRPPDQARAATRRRRRPVGEPPPLPRDLHGLTPVWVLVILAMVGMYIWGRTSGTAGSVQRAIDRWASEWIVSGRPDWAHRVAIGLDDTFGTPFLVVMRWAVIVALIAFRRWRHLAVFVATVAAANVLAVAFPTASVEGSGLVRHPSLAEAGTVVTLLGVVYGLAPRGVWRRVATAATVAVCSVVGTVLLLLGENTPVELLIGFAGSAAIASLGYRIFAPEDVFPVRYRRGRTAHLDLTPARVEAIETALHDQFGFQVASVAPCGLSASGGSTPLRIELVDGVSIFAKLYATNHLRADRWYKLGRTIMYGALEDERSFSSVRRMVEYEDHMLRYLRDHHVRSAPPVGIAELTPEREYLMLSGFVADARELTVADVDEDVIRSGVEVVRQLWEAGVAHRDVKPSNLLVAHGQVVLIDVSFCQVRPSPWRQSVDLANMLLCLALRSDAETVYGVARERFTDDDIAEAFAATKGVTIPAQLRRLLELDGRGLAETFRKMAPDRRRIPIQRWTLRRIALLAAAAGGIAFALTTAMQNLQPAGLQP